MKLLSKENFRQELMALILVIASGIALILYLGGPQSSPPDSSSDPVMDYALMKAMGRNALVVACLAKRMDMDFHTFVEKAVGIKSFTPEEKARLAEILDELKPDDEPPEGDPDMQNGLIAW
jgi:hypothetical protein